MSVDVFLGALARRRATGAVVSADQVAGACAEQLAMWGARRVLVPDVPELGELALPDALRVHGLEVLLWPVDRGWRELLGLDDAPATCAITLPRLAAAERGTLVIEGSPAHGRSLDAIGWWHLAILFADRIRPTLTDALVETFGGRDVLPSAASLVSGPSRSSDVEKITTYGAHGALAEHVLVVT